MRGISKAWATLVIAAVAIGCSEPPTSQPEQPTDLGPGRVALVNDQAIAESVFRLYSLNTLQRSADELTPEQRASMLDDIVDFALLAQAAEQRGLPRERAVAAELELLRIQLLASLMAERYLDDNPATEEEIRAIYNENLPRLAATQYRASHILSDSASASQAVIDRLTAGADFREVAEAESGGGGELGWFTLDSTPAPFANAVSSLEIGSFSTEPVETQYGWHVILLEDTRQPEPPSIDSIREELRSAANRQKLEEYLQDLRESARIDMVEN
jgi:peptidyl-prolyl cis-trans isomerase C